MAESRTTSRKGRGGLPLGFGGFMPIGVQVAVAIGSLVAMVAVCILVAVLLIVGLKEDQAQITTREVPYASAIAAAALSAKGIANDERGFLLTRDPKFIDELERRMGSARVAFDAAADAADTDEQRQAVADARSGFEQWVRALRSELATFQASTRRIETEAAIAPARELRKTYESSLAKADAQATSAIQSRETSVSDAASRSVIILLACLPIALVIGCAIALWIVRTILRPVHGLLMLFGEVADIPAAAAQGTSRRSE
jgi:methyl-accepting chemotaxis protein